MTERDQARAHLAPHPTAAHTWRKPEDVSEYEHYDEMPMTEDGDIYDSTEQPRHAKEES